MSLTPEELELLQAEAVVWMPDRCDIYKFTNEDDAYGGRGDETEELFLTGIPCSLETGAGHEQLLQLFGFERDEATFILALPADTPIETEHHIIVTTKDNLHLHVKAVMAPETEEVERRVIATSLAEHHP